MCKDPFPRDFNGLLGKEAGERDLLPDVGTYPRGTQGDVKEHLALSLIPVTFS